MSSKLYSAILFFGCFGSFAFAQQPLNCVTAPTNPVTLRQEGATEQVADLTFTCQGNGGTYTMTAYVSAPVTSAPLGTAGLTEAAVVTDAGVFPGTVSGTQVTFSSVPMPPGTSTFTLTNVRVNAFEVGPAPVTETVFIGVQGIALAELPTTTVGFIAPGLAKTPANLTFAACGALSTSSGPAFLVRAGENFASAFKTKGDAFGHATGSEFSANTETGYFINLSGTNNQASAGTRIGVLFSVVPAGTTLYVPTTLQNGSGVLTLTSSETGPFSPVPGDLPAGSIPVAHVPIANGIGEAVYEVTAQDPAAIETFTVPVYLSTTASALTGASITAIVRLSPVSSPNIPSFQDGGITTTATAASTCLPLTISPTTLSTAEQGIPFVQTLAAAGVTGGWAISSGSLPAGLSLNPTSGTITGTPTVSGSFSFTVQMTGGTTTTQSFTLQVNPPLSIVTTTLPAAVQATPYNQTLTTSGGVGAVAWTVLATQFPPGLFFDTSTGQISGLASTSGTFSITVKATDAGGSEAIRTLSVQVNTPPVICTTALVFGNPNLMRMEGTSELASDIAVTCSGTGGTGAFQVVVTSGPITSKVLHDNVTEAVLVAESGTIFGTIDSTGEVLTFSGVSIPSGTTTFTIANIRVDATHLDFGNTPVQVAARVTSTAFPTAPQQITVGYALPGSIGATVTGTTNYISCGPINATTGPAFTVHVSETFGGAFKERASPQSGDLGVYQVTETGYLLNGSTNLADSATRFRILFANVPPNTSVYVPASITAPDGDIVTLTASETGAFAAVPPVTPTSGNTLPPSPALGLVAISAGSGEAVYEVTKGNQTVVDSFAVPVYLVVNGPVSATPPITAAVSFAPVGAPSHIPNFVSHATPINATTISFCLLSSTLPDGQVGHPYGPFTLSPAGGTAPYTFTNAVLPIGLTMSSGGTITGVPTTPGAPGNSSVTIVDAIGASGQFPLQIQVQAADPLRITTTSLAPGYTTLTYNQTLQAAGGTPPYTWTLTGGSSLAGSGLSLNSATGAITGTPTAVGTIPLSVRATDTLGVAVTANLSLPINSIAPTISSISGIAAPGLAPGGIAAIAGSSLSLGNPTVWVNGFNAAYILSARPDQIVFQMPWAVSLGAAAIVVQNGLVSTSAFTVQVNPTAPGILAGGIINIHDDGTPNDSNADHPAQAGSQVSISYTGSGVTNPLLHDGSVDPLATPVQRPIVSINGVPVVVNYVNMTQIGVAGADIQVPALPTGAYNVTVTAGGVVSPPASINIVNSRLAAPPLITSLTPPVALPGSVATALLVTGQNFVSGSRIWWTTGDGLTTAITPDSIQAGQIAATVPAVLLTSAGIAQLTVITPSGVQSNAVAFTVTAPNWTLSVSPASAAAGAPGSRVILAGAYFSGTPTVTWTSPDGHPTVLTPSQIQPQQITVDIPASLLQTPGFAYIGVTGSNQLRFPVNIGTGTVTPSTAPYGSGATRITITGTTPFGSPSSILWTRPDGKLATISATLVQAAQLAATIPAAFLTTPGTAQIAVVGRSGVISTPTLPFAISSPLSITSVTPNLQNAGGGPIPITVTSGSPIAPGTTVTWTDPTGTVTNLAGLINAAQIAATVPSSLLTSAGTAQVALVDHGGVPSNQLPFRIQPFTISSVTPNSAPAYSTSTQITVAGTNLTGATTVVITGPDGQTIQFPPDLSQTTQVAATIPASVFTTPGTYQLSLADAFGGTSNVVTFSVGSVDPLTIAPTSPPAFVLAGHEYNIAFTAAGGVPIGSPTGNVTWSIVSAPVPAFVSIDSFGALHVTVQSSPGSYPLVIQAQDLSGAVAYLPFTLNVVDPLTITTGAALPTAAAGVPYSTSLSATGGIPANYSWSSPNLPSWLTLSPNGILSGTPATRGQSTFTVNLTDGAQSSGRDVTVSVNPSLSIQSSSLPGAAIGLPYSTRLAAGGGIPAYSNWTVSSGALPPGLRLDASTGVISGALTSAAGSPFAFGVTVQDSASNVSPEQGFTLRAVAPSITSLAIPAATAVLGHPVTLSAKINAADATGRVTFYDGTAILGIGTISTGQTEITTSLIPFGTHALRAYYAGDANYAPGSSTPIPLTVTTSPQAGFRAPVNYGTADSPFTEVVGDFNGDGKPDLAVGAAAGVSVLPGNGDGTFGEAKAFGGGGQLIIAADLNGDGKLDVATADAQNVYVLLGNGDGTLQAPSTYAGVTIAISALKTGDFNGDGVADLVVADGIGKTITILLGRGDGSFLAGNSWPTGTIGSASMIAADFDGNGTADLAIVPSSDGHVSILLGNGDGSFRNYVLYALDSALFPFASAVADLKQNGNLDLIAANFFSNHFTVLPGNGDGTFQPFGDIRLPSSSSATGLAIGDFNGDGKYDLAYTNTSVKSLVVLPGNGDGTFQPSVFYSVGDYPQSPVTADFNGDGLADFAVIRGGSNISILLGFAPLSTISTTLPGGTVNTSYPTTTIAATGGIPPYTWSIATGSLPAGVSLAPSTGTISGTPTASGSFPVTIRVTDSGTPALTASQNFTLTVTQSSGGGGTPPPPPPPPPPPTGTVSATPINLAFNASANSLTGSAAITVSDTATSIGFTASASTKTGGNWLTVSPVSGQTGTSAGSQTLTIAWNATGLGLGTYTGQIDIAAGDSTVSVPVSLQVSGKITVSPSSLNFTYRLGDTAAPATQTISVFDTTGADTYSVSYTGGAWLAVKPATGLPTPGLIPVSINTSFAVAGTFTGNITITPAAGTPVVVPVTITTLPAAPPKLSVSPPVSTYPLTQDSAPVAGQVIVTNTGGGTLQFTAQATSDVGTWLKLTGAASGSATSSTAAVVAYSVDPSGLQPGIYAGRITVTDSNGNQGVAGVALVLGQSSPAIRLSQSGITVNAVAGASAASTQSFSVLNAGGGTMNWTAAASTVSGGDWLSITTKGGASISGQAGSGTAVSINPAGLKAGQYYGTIEVTAPNALNSPQSLSVLLNVAGSTAGAPVSLSTGAVIFSGPAGNSPAQTQTVTLFNPGTASVHFAASAFNSSGNWLSVSPASGTLSAGASALTLRTDFTGVTAGVQTGTVRIASDDGTVDSITVIAIGTGGTAASPGSAITSKALRPLAASACPAGKASYLVTAIAEPLNNASLDASAAQLVRVLIVDDCGKPVASDATVQVSMANTSGKNDEPINLQNAGGGVWEGTWVPVSPGPGITVNAVATAEGLQTATASVTVSVAAAGISAAPQPSGIINAASSALAVPGVVTPGGIVSIYGSGFASGAPAQASSIPLPTELGDTQAFLGNQPLPLYYAGAGQINGVVPQNLNPNTSYQLTLARGDTRSVPVPVSVTQFDPAIFSLDFSGSGQGAIEIAGTAIVSAPAGNGTRPARSGSEYLSIFCTGLGPVVGANGEAPSADGAGAPSNLLYTTTAKLTATIGGVDAPVTFAGLTPGTVALYQVNVQVPAGIAVSDALPVVLTLTDPATGKRYVSNSVTVAIQ